MPDPLATSPAGGDLAEGEVHVWKTILASDVSSVRTQHAILSSAERERAGRFAFDRDRARYISGRAALRLLLGRYLEVEPEKILIGYGARGKPVLEGVSDWQFNVSHSRDLALIAVTRHSAVGIDVEFIDVDFPRDQVAPDVFDPQEIRDLCVLPPEAGAEYFFQLWTAKEALLKAAGDGFSIDPRSIRIRLGAAPSILAAPPIFSSATVETLSLAPGCAASIALMSSLGSLKTFSFEG